MFCCPIFVKMLLFNTIVNAVKINLNATKNQILSFTKYIFIAFVTDGDFREIIPLPRILSTGI